MMKGKSDKDITIARMSMRQAIVVAVIGLCSALAVAMIAQGNRNTSNPETTQEVGFYEGRATAVDQAFGTAEEELVSLVATAQVGDPQAAERLRETLNDTRTARMQVHTLHLEHIKALQDQKRIEASQIRLAANSMIQTADLRIADACGSYEIMRFRTTRDILRLAKTRPGDLRKAQELAASILRQRQIPLYGKSRSSQLSDAAE